MNNKEQYFEKIYQTSKDKIHRLCLGFTGNDVDADDLHQEIFIKVWNNLQHFRKDSNINTWIYRIATNTALLFLKKKSRLNQKTIVLKTETINQIASEEEHLITTERSQQIQQLYKAISTLKEIDRIIISLLFEECSYAEIAHITGLSTTNIGVRINRIKKSLNKKISQS